MSTFDMPVEWKSARWWANRSVEERIYHLDAAAPRRVGKHVEQAEMSYKGPTPEIGENLIITGPSATGKSALAIAIARKMVREKGASARYVTADKYTEMIFDSLKNNGDLPEEYASPYLLKWLRQAFDVVILDDLGGEYKKDIGEGFANHELSGLIRRRFENELTTIVTTQKDMTSLNTYYGSRIGSFLADAEVITRAR
jgi:DNA replication protein DnaC